MQKKFIVKVEKRGNDRKGQKAKVENMAKG